MDEGVRRDDDELELLQEEDDGNVDRVPTKQKPLIEEILEHLVLSGPSHIWAGAAGFRPSANHQAGASRKGGGSSSPI